MVAITFAVAGMPAHRTAPHHMLAMPLDRFFALINREDGRNFGADPHHLRFHRSIRHLRPQKGFGESGLIDRWRTVKR